MLRPIVSIAIITTGSAAVSFYLFYHNLSSRVRHTSHYGELSGGSKPSEIETVHNDVFTAEHVGLVDHVARAVPRASLPGSIPTDQLFTRLVRRNMTAFSRFPQAFFLRLTSSSPEEKQSFTSSHLASLDFEEGDLICGAYRVVARSDNKIEFEMKMKGLDHISGRLALSFHEREDDGHVVFCSETMMWRRADEQRKMPLEMAVPHLLHEIAAWWLLDSGVNYIKELGS